MWDSNVFRKIDRSDLEKLDESMIMSDEKENKKMNRTLILILIEPVFIIIFLIFAPMEYLTFMLIVSFAFIYIFTEFVNAYYMRKEKSNKNNLLIKNSPISKQSRYIPKDVKKHVWERDNGQCVNCGSTTRLQYDHIIPYSKGGSNTIENIQILCEKCNRQKNNTIGFC